MMIISLHPDLTPEHLGAIPSFLEDDDPRPAAEQFADRYAFGGGWRPLPHWTLDGLVLRYPGDPPFKAIAMIKLRDEIILIFDHAIVAIVQRDGGFEVSRMD